MFYEGSEKRLEITSTLNLLTFETHFWQEMVNQAGAYIISKVENDTLKAFLLSESSLFIWKNRLLLITCGETHLLQASLYFQNRIAREQISSLLFQRHQSHYPARQKSSFQQDELLLQEKLKGISRHWSENYCGGIFIFGNNQQHFATKNILMLHDLSGCFFEELNNGKVSANYISEKLQLPKYFNDFTLDQHSFDPIGYSLNAIKAEYYFTLHITPQKLSSYVSFESNLPALLINEFQQLLTQIFKPQRCYLMNFSPSEKSLIIKTKTVISDGKNVLSQNETTPLGITQL